MVKESHNYYQILDVSPEATQQNIHQAYQQAKLAYSLDNPEVFNFFSQDEVRAWNDLIDEAYAVIGHPRTRKDYDLEFDQSRTVGTDQPTLRKVPARKAAPPGFAQTSLSEYKVDQETETYLRTHEPCDGLFLKKARTYKNVDLADFSRVTCIAIRHLYAIENNNFAVLPAPVFVRGYIIQYCRVLGLDEDRVVASFMNLLKNGS